MSNHRVLMLALGILGSISCSKVPKCTYAGEFDAEANAGCLVVNQNRLLVVEDYLGQISLPGGTKNSGEAPQCTAEREVWEETGISVKAGRKIRTFDNGFQVFICEFFDTHNLDGSSKPAFSEIKRIHWLGINQLDGVQWRFPEQVALMKSYLDTKFNEVSKSL